MDTPRWKQTRSQLVRLGGKQKMKQNKLNNKHQKQNTYLKQSMLCKISKGHVSILDTSEWGSHYGWVCVFSWKTRWEKLAQMDHNSAKDSRFDILSYQGFVIISAGEEEGRWKEECRKREERRVHLHSNWSPQLLISMRWLFRNSPCHLPFIHSFHMYLLSTKCQVLLY